VRAVNGSITVGETIIATLITGILLLAAIKCFQGIAKRILFTTPPSEQKTDTEN
jgi:hypothetical protein